MTIQQLKLGNSSAVISVSASQFNHCIFTLLQEDPEHFTVVSTLIDLYALELSRVRESRTTPVPGMRNQGNGIAVAVPPCHAHQPPRKELH